MSNNHIETRVDETLLIRYETYYSLEYRWKKDPHSGFSFPCDKEGNVVFEEGTTEGSASAINYSKCVSGGYEVDFKGIEARTYKTRLCNCGSLKEREPLHDARGIFCCYMCEDCRKDKRSRYRTEVMDDPNYDTYGEAIEPEE